MKRLYSYISEFSWRRLLLERSKCRFAKTADVEIHKTAKIKGCNINVFGASKVRIGKNAHLCGADIYVNDGELLIEDNCIIKVNGGGKCTILINEGCRMRMRNNSLLSARRVWLRFGAQLAIGAYTNINHDSEIRADERIEIGSYCQISQWVNIWDTNTHNILPAEERRKVAERHFPYFGYEQKRPHTKPVIIGDDCWIGERVSILKGTQLGKGVIVGYNTTLIKCTISDGKRVVQDIHLKIL